MSEAFWDPFESSVSIRNEPQVFNKSSSVKLPGFLKNIWVVMLPICLIGFFVGIFYYGIWRIIGLGTFCGGIALVLLIDHLDDGTRLRKQNLINAAENLGFRWRSSFPQNRKSIIARQIKELLTLRVGSAIPLNLEFEMWGTSSSGVPQWMGLSLAKSASFFGGPSASARGKNAGFTGYTVMMIAAYQLQRDTQTRVLLFPEFLREISPIDIDIQTESTEFNRKYNIRLQADGGNAFAAQMSAKLLQVLTPAFQAKLIDLADQFSVRIIIDGDTVFFGGYRNLVSSSEQELQEMISRSVQAFSDAAVSFKRYAE